MITIQYNREGLEYDSYALITSFFPNMETKQVLLTDSSEPLPADAIRISLDTDARAGSVFFAKGETLREDKQFYFGCEEDTLGNVTADATSEQQAEAVNDALQKRKHAWKIFFYDTLSEYTGKTLPWGALTGVRPTKLIMAVAKETAQGDILVEEEEREAVKKRMMNEYRVSERKADLGYRIAVLEDRILEPFRYDSARGEGYSVYVGIPFCPSRCLYCSFLSYPIEKWQKQVAEEIFAARKRSGSRPEAGEKQGDAEVKDHEPALALQGGEDGLMFYPHICNIALKCLNKGGMLAVEHGYDQGDDVREILINKGFNNVKTLKDFGGNDRVTFGIL